MYVSKVDRVEDKSHYQHVLDECRRIMVEYPAACLERAKIKAQIREIERRLSSL